MLHGALIRLDSGEREVGCGIDGLGDRDHILSGVHPAATRTAVNFDEAVQFGTMLLARHG